MTKINSKSDDIHSRPPVVFLLAIWSKKYIRQFMQLSMRSLLAPGNIPAMAQHYPCRFVFLTRNQDQDTLKAAPLFAELEKHCPVEFVDISDLIFSSNHSATITLAYERGMRSRGKDMCRTYFVYLVSDYVMADGSLKGLTKYIDEGYSGVTAGNFQIIEDPCLQDLQAMIDKKTGLLSIKSRELLAYSFKYMHPITIANTVTQTVSHTSHCNRLFWRVDDQTMIGRFYLRHMLCIRPEIEDYVIGSSCDYSFIPEMCPSGKVAHIGDSDEYCVIEWQPFEHERHFIRYGELQKRSLALSLSEWTTKEHRSNAHVPVIFHVKDIPPAARNIVIESERYVADVESWLAPPIPAREHPYWVSCIEGVLEDVLGQSHQERYYRDGVFIGIFGSPVFGPVFDSVQSDFRLLTAKSNTQFFSLRRRLWNIVLHWISGWPPQLYPWHRQWRDYRVVRPRLRELVDGQSTCLFIASGKTSMADWLYTHGGPHILFQKMELLLLRPVVTLRALMRNVQKVFILLEAPQMKQMGRLIPRCIEMLPAGGEIRLLILNDGNSQFKNYVASAITSCVRPQIKDVDVAFTTGFSRNILDTRYHHLSEMLQKYHYRKGFLLHIIWWTGQMAALGLCYLVSNLITLVDWRSKWFSTTSAIVTITVEPDKK